MKQSKKQSKKQPNPFVLSDTDPTTLRKRSRLAIFKIMLLFGVIGMATATLTLHLLKPYNDNTVVLNLLGAFIGLVLTFALVNRFFSHQAWMQETVYLWELKRQLMRIYNVHSALLKAIENQDEQAMKIMRFYHLALEQLHQVEQNSHASIDLVAEKKALETRLLQQNIPLEQTRFHPDALTPYKNAEAETRSTF